MASLNSDIYIVKYDPMWLLVCPIASATTVGVGDLISVESDLATVYSQDSDDQYFIGPSQDASQSGETIDIVTYGKCVAKVTVSSSTYGLGEKLEYVSGGNGTAWIFEAGATNPIAQSMQQLDATGTGPILVAFDAQKYGIFT